MQEIKEKAGNSYQQEFFISPSRGQREFLDIISDITDFVNEDPLSKYVVVVGTDSEETITPNGHAGLANFVSVITVHRVGRHGRYFWKKISDVKTFDRHDRMLKEAYYSLELAQRVVAHLREKLNDRLYDFEIHLDIGNNGPTKTMIQEIVGMITGNGFTARIKPDSYAANKVADRHV
ncbi:MAG: ribonuclease H-like YkuK family protein [Candidatus Yanofskybacteria bacterium]|nr:ribonuclease H-like YkuK family protein [Candidatus Yanofskybacteria bacterium]